MQKIKLDSTKRLVGFVKRHKRKFTVLAVLIVVFYPKYCGRWASTQPNQGYTYPGCKCIGIKMQAMPVVVGGGDSVCLGIVTERLCYEWRTSDAEGVFKYYKQCE